MGILKMPGFFYLSFWHSRIFKLFHLTETELSTFKMADMIEKVPGTDVLVDGKTTLYPWKSIPV